MNIRIRNALFGLMSGLLLLAGLATSAAAQIITVPPELAPGAQYRLIFVTSTKTVATSPDISYYNGFVQAAADTVPELAALGPWRAIGSTATVNARDNTDTNYLNSVGLPIYTIGGGTFFHQYDPVPFSLPNYKIADNNQTFWASGANGVILTEQGTTYRSVVYTGTIIKGTKPFHFTNPTDGRHALGSGTAAQPGPAPYVGRSDGGGQTWIHAGVSNGATLEFPLYAMSGVLTVPGGDTDGDGVNDDDDNCPDDSNPGQTDTDLDGAGDACDDDDDNDGVVDGADNCPFTANQNQIDVDMDGAGDLCDDDLDGDGTDNMLDNCPVNPTPFQTDTDMDGAGDECDEDDDNDGVCDTDADGASCAAGPDNCPTLANPGQADSPDGDGIGDLCDADDDNDGSDDIVDNCPVTANADQNDTDGDMTGDACDTDDDGDGVLDDADNCQFVVNSDQLDADGDGIGDACNDANDRDGDDWSDSLDNCPDDPNSSQNDLDVDGEGDACDPDIDGDFAANGLDLCAATPSGELANPANGCTLAQLCPCDGPRGTNSSWKNHGKYVSCVAHAANDFRDAGLIFDSEHGDIVSAAGQSACGNKNK